MNLTNIKKWDNEILLRYFMQHLTRVHELKGANGYTTTKRRDDLTQHHKMLREIKERMR